MRPPSRPHIHRAESVQDVGRSSWSLFSASLKKSIQSLKSTDPRFLRSKHALALGKHLRDQNTQGVILPDGALQPSRTIGGCTTQTIASIWKQPPIRPVKAS